MVKIETLLDFEQEMTMRRIKALIQTSDDLTEKLIEIGYPKDQPENEALRNAYIGVRNAIISAVYEEAITLKSLGQKING